MGSLGGERRNAKTVLSNKITRNRIVPSFQDSHRKPLRPLKAEADDGGRSTL